MGLEVDEDDVGRRVGSDAGNLLARIPGVGARQHSAVRAPGHGAADRAGRAGARRRRLGERGRRDPRRRQQVGGGDHPRAGAAARRRPGPPRVGLELLFTVCEEISLRGSGAFDVGRLAAGSATCSITPRRSGRSCRHRPTTTGSSRELRGRAAHAGVRPEAGRSAIVAAARAIAAMRLGRLDAETTANVGTINGGTAINVMPERCRDRGRGAKPRPGARRGGRDRDDRSPPGRRRRGRMRPRRHRRARCSRATGSGRARSR